MAGGTLGRGPHRHGRTVAPAQEVPLPIDAGSLHYLVGPVIAALMVGLIALFLRWAFAPPPGSPAGRRGAPQAEGLLTPVASLTRHESALALRAVLSDAGIRSTLRQPAPHRTDVLVFPEDAASARALAMSFRDD